MDTLYEAALVGLRSATGPNAAAYAMLAVGLNVHFGYTGLLNVGQVGFMLVGAYGLAITVASFGGSFWLGLLMGVLAAVGLSLVLGLPTLRLRADYLAISTIAAAEILRLTVRAVPLRDFSGGPFGLQRFADTFFAVNPFPSDARDLPWWLPWPSTAEGDYMWLVFGVSERRIWVLVAWWGLVLLATLFVWLLVRSPWGRVLRAIREDEDAARSLGKNVFAYKMEALILGGVFGGIGGMMFVTNLQASQPEMFFPIVTFYAWSVLILGGAARAIGPVLGSLVFWFLLIGFESLLRQASQGPGVLGEYLGTGEIGAIRLAAVGLVLMLLIVYRPQGMIGNRREMSLDV